MKHTEFLCKIYKGLFNDLKSHVNFEITMQFCSESRKQARQKH